MLRAPLLLVLSLLFSQMGAQAHVYSHLRVAPQPTAATSVVTQVCVDCLAFAPLFSATLGSAEVCDLDYSAADSPIEVTAESLISGLPLHAFRSRAPPSV